MQAGDNGCILHYVENRDVLCDGDLVLIDAGCELDHYASDITRTFPVNGKFSREQKALYELVLKAQLAAINVIKPGNHWNEPHDITVQVITEGLVQLGLCTGPAIGWAWMCMMWAIRNAVVNGVCLNPAWC